MSQGLFSQLLVISIFFLTSTAMSQEALEPLRFPTCDDSAWATAVADRMAACLGIVGAGFRIMVDPSPAHLKPDRDMKPFFLSWGATAFVFLLIDAIWLGLVATSFYRRELGELMLDQPKLDIAALFYVGYTFAIVLLAAAPAARSGSFIQALVYGAVLGLAAYGTYGITNFATLKNWPQTMVPIDMIWGTVLTATAAAAGYAAYRHAS